jgi:hypothetical protein
MLLILFLFPGLARTESLSAILAPLENHREWHALLHFKPHGINNALRSEVDDDNFFLAENGATDAKSELHATVTAFLTKAEIIDQSAACKFPARYHWIKTKLKEQLELPKYQCKQFESWFAGFDAQSLTLIYPASYLNSPSSMFGHTLIRVNPSNAKQSSSLLAYSINYAANADPDDNELVFSWKGLTGGYPGGLSVLRYYEKVNEYSSIENRDIWEYDLNLTHEEVSQFLRHSWEIKNIRFDYFFFDENCAYRILTMVDAATPRFNIESQFSLFAAPVDTIRLLAKQDIVSSTLYRPSMAKILKSQIKQTSEPLSKIAINLVDVPETAESKVYQELTAIEQAKVLELAYGFIRYTDKKEKIPLKNRTKKSLSLLSKRAKLGIVSPFEAPNTPEVRDDQGHQSSRISVGVTDETSSQYLDLGLRASYHDLLDPSVGYPRGSEIEMADLQLRIDEDGGIKVQEFTLVNITSLSPRTTFFSPISWRVSGGIKRYKNELLDQAIGFLDGGSGVSYPAGEGLIFGLGEGELNADSDIDKGYAVGVGLQLGYLYQGSKAQGLLSYQYRDFFSGGNYRIHNVKAVLALNLSVDAQTRLTLEQTKLDNNRNLTSKIEYAHYF